MKNSIRIAVLATGSLMLCSLASAQTAKTPPPASPQTKKDYGSLQYGAGKVHPEQQKSIERRSQQLDQAFSDDGTTKPAPTATPKKGSATPR